MKLKIVERGWAGYTGNLGVTQFVDGVSVEDVASREANFIGSVLRVVEVDESGNDLGVVSMTAEMLRTQSISIPVEVPLVSGEGSDSPDIVAQNGVTADNVGAPAPMEPASSEAPEKLYTREELEAVADAEGIKGLRAIGTPLGAKNTSIHKLIDEIVVSQNKFAKA